MGISDKKRRNRRKPYFNEKTWFTFEDPHDKISYQICPRSVATSS